MALTTPALISFLQLREGFRKHAYDDAKPHVKLTEDTEIEGTLTVGYGTTKYPDGTPVAWHDTVSKSEAVDYLQHYIRETIEPALENLIHAPLAGVQYDALGSLIYQYGEPEVAGWKLIRRINAGEPWQNIAKEWINGTVMWMGEPLFWGRRIMELFMFLGIDWRAGENVPVLADPLEAAEAMGFDGTLPKPDPIVDPDLFNELEIPKVKPITDPTPDTPLTTSDLNKMQLEQRKNPERPISYERPQTVAITPISPKIPVASYEHLNDDQKKDLQVKAVDKSQRGKSVGKKAISKTAGTAGVGTVVGVATGTAEPVLKIVDKYPTTTLLTVALILGAISLGYYYWSEWQLQKGREDADTLLG